MTKRIAMWSGPRNISTAMMRSWENRADCSVVDEPFYACYLNDTGLQHPCTEQILAAQSCDYPQVIEQLTRGSVATPLQYQKLMTHHIPDGQNMGWCRGLKHCFLIRDPAQVIASYVQKMPSINERDIGIKRQAQLFREITAVTGTRPTVIDSNDILKNPRAVLSQLCTALEIDFLEEDMLNWPTGTRDSDGVWASHWYHNVENSTGFGQYCPSAVQLDDELQQLADQALPYYEELAAYRLRL